MSAMSLNFSVILGAIISLVGAGLGFYAGLYVGERRVPVLKPVPRLKILREKVDNVLLDPVEPSGGGKRG